MKAKEYYIVEGKEWTDIVNEVNAMLKKGWVTTGGIFRAADENNEIYYMQAMILPS